MSATLTTSEHPSPSPAPLAPPAILRLDPTTDSGWDASLATCSDATFFHGSAWARALKAAYGYTPRYLAIRQGHRIGALLPLMEVSSWLTGRRAIALPFTDECAPLAANAETAQALHDHACALGRQNGWKYLEYRGGRSLFPDAPAFQSFVGHRLDLTGGPEACHRRLTKPTRNAVKKAETNSLTIEFSQSIEALREFYGLVCKTRRRLGVPPQPYSFYAALHRHLFETSLGWIVLARTGNTPIAGNVYFPSGKAVIYKYSASDEAYRHLSPNNFVKWRAIQRFSSEGFERMDFGRTDLSNEGLRRYKTGWGAEEYPIEYVRYDLRANRFTPPIPASTSGGWKTRLCQKLPEPALRLMGSLLYKHVA